MNRNDAVEIKDYGAGPVYSPSHKRRISDVVEHIDLAYLDANHTFGATIRYAKMILPKVLPSSILVIGGIHWSEGMKKAWKSISSLKQVTLSVDLFHCGLLFFLPVKDKQEYIISF